MQITFTLAGANFRPADAKDELKSSSIGDTVTLERDDENEYDVNAVRVLLNDTFVGFIPKTDNSGIAQFLDDSNEIASAEIIGYESSLKPIIEVEYFDEDE